MNYTDVMSTHSGFLLNQQASREKPQNQGASLLRHNDKFNKVMTQRNGKKIRLKGVGTTSQLFKVIKVIDEGLRIKVNF